MRKNAAYKQVKDGQMQTVNVEDKRENCSRGADMPC
jgi:hypothetical protein